uniref:Uncharacterized protein n=1 Tax=Anguilla anguilla TaxID=7936 RepID=A0A0E9V6N2_ANGAN
MHAHTQQHQSVANFTLTHAYTLQASASCLQRTHTHTHNTSSVSCLKTHLTARCRHEHTHV